MQTLVPGVLAAAVALATLAAAPQEARPAPDAARPAPDTARPAPDTEGSTMELGAFSISLAVKDIAASRAFYETLGFRSVMGEPTQNWLILRNGDTTIGLFQGMFERNILTFNPGWDAQNQGLKSFQDVRDLHAELKAAGATMVQEAGLDGDGPASFVLVDPDGNPVLVDQHVPRPER